MASWWFWFRVVCLINAISISVATDIYGLVGSAVQLICPHRAINTQKIRWSKIGNKIIVYTINDVVNNETLSEEIYRRLSVTGNHTAGEYNLNISDIRQTDAGDYECLLSASVLIQRCTLHVIDGPTNVVIDNKNITSNRLLGTEGQNLRVKCTAVGGDPDPDVKLHIQGPSTTHSGVRSIEYTIQTINRSYDGQTVTCTASNNPNTPVQRSDSAVIYLNLKPLTPIFNKDQISTEETVPLVVSCTSHGSRPAGNFLWLLGQNSINVTPNSTQHLPVHNTTTDTYTVTSTLTVNVDRTYNGQNILCRVSNPANSIQITATKVLDIKYAPYITVQNKTYIQNQTVREVECALDGNPASYNFDKWQHKSAYGTLIRELEGIDKLLLPSLPVQRRYQDTGEYICTASNGIKDKSGKLKQTGAGYITSKALPVFTSDNNIAKIQYGGIGRNTEIYINVYSLPKYDTIQWYRGNVALKPCKYETSEAPAILKDMFHGVEIELNGYKVTLSIYVLSLEDFDNYTLRVGTGSEFVEHTVVLSSVVPANLPTNVHVTGPSESTITVKWNVIYNKQNNQTFNIEYRKHGSSVWSSLEINVNENDVEDMVSHTITGLQDGTLFEVRFYTKNINNEKVYTDVQTIQTVIKDSQTLHASVVGGVAGGLVAVIIILLIFFIVVVKRLQGAKASAFGRSEKGYDNIGMESTSNEVTNQDEFKPKKRDKFSGCPKTYEAPSKADQPSLYDELKEIDESKQSAEQQYETLGTKDMPNIYEELDKKQKHRQNLRGNKKSMSS